MWWWSYLEGFRTSFIRMHECFDKNLQRTWLKVSNFFIHSKYNHAWPPHDVSDDIYTSDSVESWYRLVAISSAQLRAPNFNNELENISMKALNQLAHDYIEHFNMRFIVLFRCEDKQTWQLLQTNLERYITVYAKCTNEIKRWIQ